VTAEVGREPRGRVYELWLYNSRGDAVSLGTCIRSARGLVATTRRLPGSFAEYAYVDLSLERDDDDGAHDGRSVLRGALSEVTGAVPGP